VSDALPHIQQPGDMAGPDAARNIRVNAQNKANATMGPREGTAAAFEVIGTGGRVQSLFSVSTAAGTSLRLGDCSQIAAGSSKPGIGIIGHAFVVDTDNSLALAFMDPSSDIGNDAATSCSWHSDGTKAGTACIFFDPTTLVASTRVTLWNATTGAVIWTTLIQDKEPGGSPGGSPFPIFANSLRVYDVFTFVTAGPWIFVLRTSDGVYIKRLNVNGWTWEVQDARIRPDGMLAVLFLGTSVTQGPVTASSYNAGGYFRSAIALYTVNNDTTVNGTPLSIAQYGVRLSDSDPNYEDHPHFRFSEKLARSPRGMAPFALAIGTDGRTFFGGSNTGFGPTDSQPPDGTGGYSTVGCISAGTTTAALVWEADTLSNRDNWLGTGWYNDIPYDAFGAWRPGLEDSPGVNGLAADPDNNVYAVGRLNAAGYNVFKLRGTDGAIMWQATTGALAHQHGVWYDTFSGLVTVVGVANDDYPNANSQFAQVWRFNPDSGNIVNTFYIEKPSTAYGVDVHPTTGKMLFVCDRTVTP
jgi:hypothetical protein